MTRAYRARVQAELAELRAERGAGWRPEPAPVEFTSGGPLQPSSSRRNRRSDPSYRTYYPPTIAGLPRSRCVEIEQTLARTGSIAATMRRCEVSYETVHTLLEWMAA